ncbi:Retrovirus-related Pol polyprotein from transposon TNT 1-94 [Sesamum angolense]|uniref:Retrovirus-related Pol polyprotein from transposon TNT 1-94 n=1 Tax=Sesamum angolense TaxID=2727404 RepID=A0AAE1VZU2_9LAMI|nr:Retrovirus-related Pol polyprotein from transposon TNT 1-94 [Sesamum angolense]
MAAVLSASLYMTLDALSRGPRLRTFQTSPQRLKQSPKTDKELKWMLDIPCASAVGSIQYVAQCTKPDITYALRVTSICQACAGEAHWTAVKTIIKYLSMTKDVLLVYDGGELILEGFSNDSFQSDDDAESQSGFVFKLNGGVVAWKSSKQDTTVDSTTEAEYIAASDATKDTVWMKNYIQELGFGGVYLDLFRAFGV